MLTPKEILQRALARLGPNGEYWFKGGFYDLIKYDSSHHPLTLPKDCPVCARAALSIAAELPDFDETFSPIYHNARDILSRQTKTGIPAFNDCPTTTFPDIRAAFERAIAACDEE